MGWAFDLSARELKERRLQLTCYSISISSPEQECGLPFPLVISDSRSVPPVCPAILCFKPNNFSRVRFGCWHMSSLLACDLPLQILALVGFLRFAGWRPAAEFFVSLIFVSGFQFPIVCGLL
jgi:hypothetical protein